MFELKEVSEYFSSESYKYVIGVVNLETLYRLGEQLLRSMDVFIINTGRKYPNSIIQNNPSTDKYLSPVS